jgi:hypothetical protein
MLDRWAAEDVDGEPEWDAGDAERVGVRTPPAVRLLLDTGVLGQICHPRAVHFEALAIRAFAGRSERPIPKNVTVAAKALAHGRDALRARW